MLSQLLTLARGWSRMNMLIAGLLVVLSGVSFDLLKRTVKAAPPTTWNVSVGNPGACTIADPNCATIGAAVSASTAGDTISVAAGTYNEHDIAVSKDLTINGAGAKTTIVDAQQLGRVLDTFGATINISGLTIKNGLTSTVTSFLTSKNRTSANGIGVALQDGVGIDGGGIINQGTLTLTDCAVTNNATASGGGGLILQNLTKAPESDQRFAHVVKVRSNNQSPAGQPGGSGGGIFNGGTLTLINCTVSNNSTGNGGDSDTTGGNGGDGGGIFNGGTLTVTNSTIANNRTGRGGNIISIGLDATRGDTPTLVTGPTPGNGGEGGGISNSGSLDIRNSTIAGNQTGPAGGFSIPGVAKGANGSVSPSDASAGYGGNGGGLYTGATMVSVIVQSTIIATNTVGGGGVGPDVFSDIAIDSLGYNLIGIRDGSSGFGPPSPPTDQSGTLASPLNPLLSSLGDNGGQTQTMALLTNSPAIDKGINSGCDTRAAKAAKSALGVCGLAFDQRGAGFPRTVDNPSVVNAADGTDVGAFELTAPAESCAPDTTPPTIACPGSMTKFTDSGQSTATVNPGLPVAADNCALQSVTGVRNDGKALNAPYPLGMTLITWTARDGSGNTTSCVQSIGVMMPSRPRRIP